MNLSALLEETPLVHADESGSMVYMGLEEGVLRLIDEHVGASSKTLETGCGTTTALFALKGADHVCISPLESEVGRVREYCREHGISDARVTYHLEYSESVLPRLDLKDLDLILIDGGHGFPLPFIDFFYTAKFLKVGGLLLIDDVHLWTGKVLKDFLAAEKEWELRQTFRKTVVFAKLEEWTVKEWDHQPFTLAHSNLSAPDAENQLPARLRRALRLIRKGEFGTLAAKITRNLSGGSKA
ncbi:MAG TPA: class I SAM-dependent methyltransferase [Pyrinomonadaceae bacterium]|nr:class I SAM-dependent methyltransferase [Pyrinomonadaceae bacterium]